MMRIRSRVVLATLFVVGASLFSLSAQSHPSHEITNGEITATVYLPDAGRGFYRTTRFDWSGAVGSLKYKGHEYYGRWFSRIGDIYDFGYEGPAKDVISADFTAMVGPAEEFGAMVMVDDSHATGFVGRTGRGTPEHCGVQGRIDVLTGTMGKALGGASGGYTAARKEIVELLRQRSRPYLFSNTVAPAIVGATHECLRMLGESTALRDKLEANTRRFREGMTKAGFKLRPGVHPICPIMLGDARVAVDMADRMLKEGIYVIGFYYPVVPKGLARIRVQISAGHEAADVDRAIAAFTKVGKDMKLI